MAENICQKDQFELYLPKAVDKSERYLSRAVEAIFTQTGQSFRSIPLYITQDHFLRKHLLTTNLEPDPNHIRTIVDMTPTTNARKC